LSAGQPKVATWGAEVSALSVRRVNRQGETSFSLDIPGTLTLDTGKGRLNRLPVMGHSGAGKSTFLNLLACTSFPQNPGARVRWRFPDGFEVEWGPEGPGRAKLVQLRQKYFGYAFQTASLQPQLTIGENLTFGLENTGVSHRLAAEKALEALVRAFSGDEARARNMFHRFDSEISGGERQRISLLQALVRDPYVLFADEPTGSLDKSTRKTVMTLLTDWLAEKPEERLFVWVTHHETDPQDNGADTRLLVQDGAVKFQSLAPQGWADMGAPVC
jgi:ABC-type lipoprotein export system ATPase subunit